MFSVSTYIVLLASILLVSEAASNSRTLCYSGSTLYQRFIQDCNAQNSNYTGTWYCAEVEVCESFISGRRTCISTKGCATEEQCYDTGSSSTGTLYNGNSISNAGSQLPAGMTISPKCCLNSNLFNDDDSALDFDSICNNAFRIGSSLWVAIGTATIFAVLVHVF